MAIRASLLVALTCTAAFAQQPRIDSVSPSQGPIAGGTIVTIKGANFTGAAVTLDRASATPLSSTDSEIRLQMPRHDNGYAVVSVRTAGGVANAEFLYIPPRLDEIPPGYITTVAGVGNFVRHYGPAVAANVDGKQPKLAPDGSILIADPKGNRVYRIRTDGLLEVVAGNGSAGSFIGDGGAAIDAAINFPEDVAVDPSGNVYVSDQRYRLRKIDTHGVITTIAGNGTLGFSGDGGPASAALTGNPTYIAVDRDDLFFIDSENNRIRRIHLADGNITTFAGNGVEGFSGDGGAATAASFNIGGYDNGGLALDPAGDLYVNDEENRRIRRIDRRTGVITTIYTMTGPVNVFSIACDSQGNIYYGSSGRIVELTKGGQIVGAWGNGSYGLPVDGVLAVTAALGFVAGIAVDAGGNIIYADGAIARIRRIDAATGLVSTLAGIGPATIGENGSAVAAIAATGPEGTALAFTPAGELLIGDSGQMRLRKLDRSGNLLTIAGTGSFVGVFGDGVPAIDSVIYPIGLRVYTNGSIDVAQKSDIVRITSDGRFFRLGGQDPSCGYEGDGGPFRQSRLCQPWDITRDANGNLFIADTNNNRIRRVDATTNVITTFAGNGGPVNGIEHYGAGRSCGDGGTAFDACFNTPFGLEFDPDGNLYVAEQDAVRKISPSGSISTFVRRGGLSKLLYNRGFLYSGVLRFDGEERATRLAGGSSSGSLGDGGPALQARVNTGGPAVGIAIDADGNYYFADVGNGRIRAIRYGAFLAPTGATIQATASRSTITVHVFDAEGRPAPSVRVDFTAPASGPSCRFANNANAIGVVTDQTGVAVASCTPNCAGNGSFAVTARPLTATAIATVTMSDTTGPCRRRAVRH